ncbi:Endopolyphosphatase [Nowakowskiella sp. JEL0078]|nr:Endopolyphosphatase [Nowakowskiella sp. JEL0078]
MTFLFSFFISVLWALDSSYTHAYDSQLSNSNSFVRITSNPHPFETWYNENIADYLKEKPLDLPSLYEESKLFENAINGFVRYAHVTDIHLDPFYDPNSSAESYCHQSKLIMSPSESNPFGQRNSECDTPPLLLKSTFQSLKNNLRSQFGTSELGFLLWTGDTARHDRDPKTPRKSYEVLKQNTEVVSLLTKYLNVSSTLVIPSIGNWDVDPPNLFGGSNTAAQLQDLFETWKPLLSNARGVPDPKISETFLSGGYFSRVVIHGRLSVVSVNTLAFFVGNTVIPDCKPLPVNLDLPIDESSHVGDHQVAWLVEFLRKSRLNGIKVILSGHVPPITANNINYKSECLHSWATISGEFSDVIIGQYFGHINRDTVSFVLAPRLKPTSRVREYIIKSFDSSNVLEIDLQKWRIVGSLYTSPSIIPVFNPALKIGVIGIQHENAFIMDHSQLSLNLVGVNREAQMDGSPFNDGKLPFRSGCSLRNSFGLQSGSSDGWSNFLESIQNSVRKSSNALNPTSGLLQRFKNCEVVRTGSQVNLPVDSDILTFILVLIIIFSGMFFYWLFQVKQTQWKETERNEVRLPPTQPPQSRRILAPTKLPSNNATQFDEDEQWNSLSITNPNREMQIRPVVAIGPDSWTRNGRKDLINSVEYWPIAVQRQQRLEKYRAMRDSNELQKQKGVDGSRGSLDSDLERQSFLQGRTPPTVYGSLSSLTDHTSPRTWERINDILSPAMPKHSSRLPPIN